MSPGARKAPQPKSALEASPYGSSPISGARLTLVAFAVRGPAHDDSRDAVALAYSLKEAVEELKRRDALQARVFELHYYAGLDAGRIAALIDLTDEQAAATLQAARMSVRAAMLLNPTS